MNELEDKSKEYIDAKAQGENGEKKRNQHQKDMWGIFTCLTFLSPEFPDEREKMEQKQYGFPHYLKVEHSYEPFHKLKCYEAKYQLLWC